MKLTESKLKKLIVEVMNEVRVMPDPPSVLSPEELSKIHDLINSGDESYINMAMSIIDGKGGDPSYVENYMRYHEVGEVEKLANKHGVHANSLGLDGDANLAALEDYFTELDKFEDREWKRGRSDKDPAREFYDRYQKVADMYKPKYDEDEE
tara:strand:- start:139 stop:594 length:456 start_codon:yes stop_codon:yes gene_type:complete